MSILEKPEFSSSSVNSPDLNSQIFFPLFALYNFTTPSLPPIATCLFSFMYSGDACV
jgi:hypothetical protein